MKQTITVLFLLLVFSLKAEEFNWSWEKTQGGEKATEIKGRKTVGNGLNPVSNTTASITGNRQSSIISRESSGSSPYSIDKLPIADGQATTSAPNGNFTWLWEKKSTTKEEENSGGKKAGEKASVAITANAATGSNEQVKDSVQGVPVPLVRPSVTPAPFPEKTVSANKQELSRLPPEVEDLSGAIPRSTNKMSLQHVNAPSLPVPAPVSEVRKFEIADAKPATGGSIDSKAYDELIRENLDLRSKITEIKQGKDFIKLENEKLIREIKDLEQRISDLVVKIKDLGKQKELSADSPVKVKELESRLIKAEQEEILLSNQLTDLQKKISDQDGTSAVDTPETSANPLIARNKPAEPVQVGSDLYKRLESENLFLRQKLSELDIERQRAVKAREEMEKKEKTAGEEARRAIEAQKQIKEKLDEAKAAEKKQKKIVGDLAERIPDMEKEMGTLKKKLSEKDVVLREKDKNLEILANEIQQRENRIRKAEKMVELMDQAQNDVNKVSDSERRDMHYNMAAVYSQVGRFRDAEREYLHALRIDPTDADVHYNLGILYDENLNDKPRAAMHYRRYLKLRPNGSDVDTVKNWLINIDMKQ
ncbi:MAG: tetratricopeptide repeat protein [Kiritimatiellae bacterium]|nr:tetratricopeptide repeat protein [Kiritimatiellia bacterium]MDD5521915.1 tetratricopeptide repeat protein [Kiritimatiellia bacterium]